MNAVLRRFNRATAAALVAAMVTLSPHPLGAASTKQFSRVKGVVGYQPTKDAPLRTVVSRLDLPDDAIAVTRDNAAALLTLPDSSIVALGANTSVQVGAFNDATTTSGPGAQIVLNGGALRFDIRRPAGGTANYVFSTATSQVAVRGTIGLMGLDGAGTTTVACVVCEANSIVVTVGGRTFALLAGQVLTVTALGAVTTAVLSGGVLGGFSSAGVSTSTASGAAGATSGVASGAAAGTAGAAAGVSGAVAAGAAAAVAGAAIVTSSTKSNNSTPAPQPTATPLPQPSPTPTATATPTPAPTPTPTATPTASPTPTPTSSGTVTIQKRPGGTVPAEPRRPGRPPG